MIDVQERLPFAFIREATFFSNSTRRFVLWAEINLEAMEVKAIEGIANDHVDRTRHYSSSRVPLIDPVADVRGPESAICNPSERYLPNQNTLVPDGQRGRHAAARLIIKKSDHGTETRNGLFFGFRGRSRLPSRKPGLISSAHLLPCSTISTSEWPQGNRPLRESNWPTSRWPQWSPPPI